MIQRPFIYIKYSSLYKPKLSSAVSKCKHSVRTFNAFQSAVQREFLAGTTLVVAVACAKSSRRQIIFVYQWKLRPICDSV